MGGVRSLHQEAAQRLRELILEGDLPAGGFLDEAALCEQLGISRTPLREALKVLVAEGLLRHEPRQGCFVYEMSARDLEDIFPIIALLEGRAVYEATLKARTGDLEVLAQLHERLAQAVASEHIGEYYDVNRSIHEAFITLADNRWLAEIIHDLRKMLLLARKQQLHVPGRLQDSLKEHLEVFDAMRQRAPQQAERVMREHLLQQREALRTLDSQTTARPSP